MARREGGGRRGNDNFLAMIAGGVASALLDYGMQGTLPDKIGYITPAKGGNKVPITASDYAQFGISTALGAYGFIGAGSGSRIPAFAYGMAITQIITKFIFPAIDIPRYIIYDIDSQGRLVRV